MKHAECLRELAAVALRADSPDAKLVAMTALAAQRAVSPPLCFETRAGETTAGRGRFAGVPRVAPDALPRRNPASREGRAALIHAITHIEYVAIDLALDHALRFPGLPPAYYADWLDVADEESRHFAMLRAHLRSLGFDYGAFPVHEGLWQMAEKTAHDVLARMAMVPRLLEARGLDATPPIQRKLAAAGDAEAVALLDVILRDEEGHVRLGDRWFRHVCAERGLAPEATFVRLIRELGGPWPQTPMNVVARLAAGFTQEELDGLTAHRDAR